MQASLVIGPALWQRAPVRRPTAPQRLGSAVSVGRVVGRVFVFALAIGFGFGAVAAGASGASGVGSAGLLGAVAGVGDGGKIY